MEKKKEKGKTKKKSLKNVPKGIAHILATFNNTIVTITDMSGNAICWSSTGSVGFSGSKNQPHSQQEKQRNMLLRRLRISGGKNLRSLLKDRVQVARVR